MKISTSPVFHAKVQVLKFLRFLFSCFDHGSRKFGPRESFPLYGSYLYSTNMGVGNGGGQGGLLSPPSFQPTTYTSVDAGHLGASLSEQ